MSRPNNRNSLGWRILPGLLVLLAGCDSPQTHLTQSVITYSNCLRVAEAHLFARWGLLASNLLSRAQVENNALSSELTRADLLRTELTKEIGNLVEADAKPSQWPAYLALTNWHERLVLAGSGPAPNNHAEIAATPVPPVVTAALSGTGAGTSARGAAQGKPNNKVSLAAGVGTAAGAGAPNATPIPGTGSGGGSTGLGTGSSGSANNDRPTGSGGFTPGVGTGGSSSTNDFPPTGGGTYGGATVHGTGSSSSTNNVGSTGPGRFAPGYGTGGSSSTNNPPPAGRGAYG